MDKRTIDEPSACDSGVRRYPETAIRWGCRIAAVLLVVIGEYAIVMGDSDAEAWLGVAAAIGGAVVLVAGEIRHG